VLAEKCLILQKTLPYFGPYQEEREQAVAVIKQASDLLGENTPPKRILTQSLRDVPTVKDYIGKALPNITSYEELNNTVQVVALIDEVGCRRLALGCILRIESRINECAI